MDRIPLFPLGGVLLPGCTLPLRLFERRYLVLLADLAGLPADRRRFGVIAIRRGYEVGEGQAGELHDIGCEALLEGVQSSQSEDPPVFGVLLSGQRPFRLIQIAQDAGRPYEVADVEWLSDEPESDPRSRGAASGETELRAAHAAYLAALGVAPVRLTADGGLLAFEAADNSLLEPHQRQTILEERDPAARNTLLARILRREAGLTARFHALPQRSFPSRDSFN